jgi:hypothetical protein
MLWVCVLACVLLVGGAEGRPSYDVEMVSVQSSITELPVEGGSNVCQTLAPKETIKTTIDIRLQYLMTPPYELSMVVETFDEYGQNTTTYWEGQLSPSNNSTFVETVVMKNTQGTQKWCIGWEGEPGTFQQLTVFAGSIESGYFQPDFDYPTCGCMNSATIFTLEPAWHNDRQ